MMFRKQTFQTVVAAFLLALCLVSVSTASARPYTREHPLVYEDAWDLWPYVYLNEKGQPEGYNIDMLNLLLKELDIPFVVKLKPTNEALEDLKAGRSDLMLGMAASFHDEFADYGREVVSLFTHSVVTPKSRPVLVHNVEDLSRVPVMLHRGSFSHHLMLDSGWHDRCIPYDDMKEAILKLSADEEGQIVWNTLSLRWLINKYKTDNLQLTPIDTPHGEYHFMSNDSVLLHRLDSAYAQLCLLEKMVPIQNKWFYPERAGEGLPRWIWPVAALVVVLLLLTLFYQVVLRIRERRMARLVNRHNRRLALILRTTKVRVWLYDVESKMLSWMNSDGNIVSRRHSLEGYGHLYQPESFATLKEHLTTIAQGRVENSVVELVSGSNNDNRDVMVRLSVFRRDKKGTPKVIVGVLDDITERQQQRRKAKDNMLRYQSIFSNSMVDMIYYDTEGRMADINQKACATFECDREQLLAERVPFNFALEDPDLTVEDFDGSYSTHIIKAVDNPHLASSIRFRKDKYYEQQLLPVYDAANRFLGIFGSGRDVTEFVESYHKLKRSIDAMMSAAQDVTEYIKNINYALHVGGLRLVNYSPKTHILTIYREMNVVQLTLTQSRCLSLLADESRRQVVRIMNNMDMGVNDVIDLGIFTTVRLRQNQRLALQFHLTPVLNARGEVENYFGMCRDVTQEKAAAADLEREKAKAQEVESVKNAFLRNMSYEIRTPITTVVGFAELFVEEHDLADEDVFISEIKTNATYLLKLVNDILFLSRLDARMIEFKKEPVEFATTFEGHCQMGWAVQRKPGVDYRVVNPYDRLVVEIDDGHVGYVIEKIVESAARHTGSGLVCCRFDYIGDRLLITVDDSGEGFSASAQETMFERFGATSGNGTDLSLPICLELVHQMNGAINVNSAPGRGTTIWIEIPCKATIVEKRKTAIEA